MNKVLALVLVAALMLLGTSCSVQAGNAVSEQPSDEPAVAVSEEISAAPTSQPDTSSATPSRAPSTPAPSPARKNFAAVYSAPKKGFFTSDERQEEYTKLYTSYQYKELLEYVNNYLDTEEDCPSNDSAYDIVELIEPLIEYQDSWVVSFDEFNSKYSLTFPGADAISSSSSVAVCVEDSDLQIDIGFRKSGWLFFDYFAFSADGEVVYDDDVDYFDVTRTILSGKDIEERYTCHFFTSFLEPLDGAETVMLRFENTESGEKYDHTLSTAEKTALTCGRLVEQTNKDLRDLLFDYKMK